MNFNDFIVTRFISALIISDPAGNKRHYPSRYADCFIITKKGRIRFSYAGGEVFADAAHAVFLPRGFNYTNECLEAAESFVFNFYTLQGYSVPAQFSINAAALAETVYAAINSTRDNCLIMKNLYNLAHRLSADSTPASPLLPVILKTATEYAELHFTDRDITLKEIAQHCSISEIYLIKLFKKHLATTPHRFITELRMERAKLLIKEMRPLKEVALNVGYSDVFQFSRAYKRCFGYPPSKST